MKQKLIDGVLQWVRDGEIAGPVFEVAPKPVPRFSIQERQRQVYQRIIENWPLEAQPTVDYERGTVTFDGSTRYRK